MLRGALRVRLGAATFGVLFAAVPSDARGQAAAPAIDFSGVIWPQYRYATDNATKAANGGHAANKFDVERVYLTFRMPAGDDGSIRITTDVFNNGSSCSGCYAGWSVRLKYGYFQYNFLHDIGGRKGLNAAARIGMIPAAVVEHIEGFWPRWISQVALERGGFFASSDVGAAAQLTMPGWGEAYAMVVNGGGYTVAETDPYKDVAARLSITPWGTREGFLKTATISPWIYRGKTASKFLTTAGSAGTAAADGLTRNRMGIFAGVKDRRFTAGAEWGRRTETFESGTTLATRTAADNNGTLTSAFALIRPAELFASDPKFRSKWGVHARLDNLRLYDNATVAGAQGVDAANALSILGLWYDLNQRVSFSLDMQHLKPKNGSTTVESKVLFVHGMVAF
jgi:hypothetical protein